MKFEIKIKEIQEIDEIQGYWTNEDYIALLDEMSFPDAEDSAPSELLELLYMAINDFDPDEAASILLNYKLADQLSKGQVQGLSHEMREDKVAEEYPDISLHYALFNINQLLYKAYNGRFPNTKATKMKMELVLKGEMDTKVTKEVILKALNPGLRSENVIKRLFEDQLAGEIAFKEVENIIWELQSLGENQYTIITSKYWIDEEDILDEEFLGTIKMVKVHDHGTH